MCYKPNAWEQRKLGEVAEVTMGQSPKSDNYTQNPKDYILVQGNADISDGTVVPRVWTTQITKLADKGDLLLTVRAPVGEVAKTPYEVVIGRGVAAIKGNEFVYQYLLNLDRKSFWKSLSTGSTFESINSYEIKNLIICFPSNDEQHSIGKTLKSIDNLITLHQRNYLN